MARVNYNPLPDVEAQGIPNDRLNIEANPSEFGGQIGAAEKQAGSNIEQGAEQIGNVAMQLKQIANNTATLNATTAASKELGQLDQQFFQNKGSAAGAAFPAYQKAISDLQAKYAGQFTGLAQQRFLQDFRSYADRSQYLAGHYVSDQTVQANVGAVKGAIEEEQSRATRDVMMTGQMPNFDRLVELNKHLAGINGWSDDQTNAAVQQSAGLAVHNAIVTRIAQGDTAGAEKIFAEASKANAPGTDLPLLDGNHQAALTQFIQNKQYIDSNRALTEQMRQMAFAERQQREAAEKSGNAIVQQIMSDPTKVDPAAIANDPALTFDQKLHLNDVLQQQLTKPKGDLLSQSYGAGFVPALHRVLAPEGDPTRITDPMSLWELAANDKNISPAGISALTGIISGRRTPDGDAVSKIQSSVLSYAKQQLSFEMQMGNYKLADPKGEQAYDIGFVPAFLKYWNDGLKAGKTPYELADKDEIDKVIKPFQRTPTQRASDMINAEDAVPVPGTSDAPAQRFDLKTAAGIVSAYKAGNLKRDQAAQMLVQEGFASAAAPDVPEP